MFVHVQPGGLEDMTVHSHHAELQSLSRIGSWPERELCFPASLLT